MKLQLRGEAFNVFNIQNLDAPSAVTINSSAIIDRCRRRKNHRAGPGNNAKAVAIRNKVRVLTEPV